MNKYLVTFLSTVVLITTIVFAVIGIRCTVSNYLKPSDVVPANITEQISTPNITSNITSTSNTSAEFITGPLTANIGELCVFKLNNAVTRADWVIVPPANVYIDSSGSSLVFASNISAKYTIIAAIVDNGQPKILTHVCEYGTTPRPSPEPNPTPPTTLKDWVTQNIPPDGKTQSAALADCYEAVADSINNGTIKTIDAGYALLRSTTQTKIKTEILTSFLDKLAVKISEQLKDNSDVKKLASLFKEIAQGLKAAANIETNIAEENNIEYSENTEAVTNVSPHPTEKPNVSTPPRLRTFFPSRK